jgi:hypothetical protein
LKAPNILRYTIGGKYWEGFIVPSIKPKLNFVIDKILLNKIDKYRFKHHFTSRSAAIIHLLTYAINQDPPPPEKIDKDAYYE